MISTHVLDTSLGRPAAGVRILLEHVDDGGRPTEVARAETDADGRVRELLAAGQTPSAGTYRLVFETGAYFLAVGVEAFYPRVVVLFTIRDPSQHHHVPLLLSPFGYSTYRGS